MDLKPTNGILNWQGHLIGFVERDDATIDDKMIIRIESDVDADDIYISFNRAIGFNSETVENKDQVVVSERPEGFDFRRTTRVGQLSSGNVHTVENFENTNYDLLITVDSINLETVPARAKVTIQFGPAISRDVTMPKFVEDIQYRHNVVESEEEWEARVGSHDILNGANGDIRAYFDHYGITMPEIPHWSLAGEENFFDPDSSKLANIPIDCTKRDSNFIVSYTGVGRTLESQSQIKTNNCAWFVRNNWKFCALVDVDPSRAIEDAVAGEIVRPRIFQTCHQECDAYTHCSSKSI